MDRQENLHFVGIGGIGMSSLAQIHAMAAGKATGSDRLFDMGENLELKDKLEALSIRLFRQDGSGVGAGTDGVVLSTAIEDANPDVAAARRLGKPVIHRSELLGRHVERSRTIAVTGTSGKSTAAAMIFEILEGAGAGPSVITGARLASLRARGLYGNAWRGKSSLLVIEADESDGSLLNYRPHLAVVLNLTRDHKEVAVMERILAAFASGSASAIVNADDPNLRNVKRASSFGLSAGDLRPEELELSPAGSRFSIQGTPFTLPLPGRYNVENALAAVAACRTQGIPLDAASRALASYMGISRRFESVGAARGVSVIDDYAHNPAKIAAVLEAATLMARRVHAVYQPHGFAPTRLLKADLIEAFARGLRPQDILWMPDIYYVGGTTTKDISSGDITAAVAARGRHAEHVPARADLAGRVAQEARPGDLVVVMGARDPSLPDFARSILQALRK